MDDLCNALEDAKFVCALIDNEEQKREWKLPKLNEVEDFKNRIYKNSPKSLNAEFVCQKPLGMYLFINFAVENGDKVFGKFVHDLALLRVSKSISGMQNRLFKLFTEYIAEGYSSHRNYRGVDLHSAWSAELTRPVGLSPISTEGNSWELGGSNLLGIRGLAIDRVRMHFEDCSLQRGNQRNSTRSRGSVMGIVIASTKEAKETSKGSTCTCNHQHDSRIFDEVDKIVFHLLAERHWSHFLTSPTGLQFFQYLLLQSILPTAADFSLLRVLGRGGFGLVTACRKKDCGRLFAAKAMNKRRVQLKHAESLALVERELLALVDSQFIVCMRFAYTSPTELVMVLELMTGGDLRYHMSLRPKHVFSADTAKYYTARAVMSLAALHELHIVYRDLKPENILLDTDGISKLSDLGLACQLSSAGIPENGDSHMYTSGLAGTRGYWAPEMVRRNASDGRRGSYSLSADWFSLGCMLFEFLTGDTPFASDQKSSCDVLLLEGTEVDCSQLPVDENCKDLLRGLLRKDPVLRLGHTGWTQVASHRWFGVGGAQGLSAIPPPIIPVKEEVNAAAQDDIGDFDEEESKSPISEEAEKKYKDWSFVAPKSFQMEVVEMLKSQACKEPESTQKSQWGVCSLS